MNPQVGDYETLFGESRPAKALAICSLQIPLLYKYQCHSSGSSAQPAKTRVIETDGVALFLSPWALKQAGANPDAEASIFVAMTVRRKQADGRWKVLIENALMRSAYWFSDQTRFTGPDYRLEWPRRSRFVE